MTIQYKILAEIVTEEQAKAAEHYNKQYLTETLELKKKEFYFEQQLGRVDYYLDNDEDADTVMVQLAAPNVNMDIIKREKIGEFTMEFGEFYREDEPKLQFRELYNLDRECICQEEINLETGLPDMGLTTKFILFSEEEDRISHALFEYNTDGSFKCCKIEDIDFMDDYDNGIEHIEDFSLVKKQLRLSDAWFDYYATAHFYPTGLI